MQDDARTPFADLPLPQQAGILCNDPRFQRFAAARCGLPDQQFNPSACAHFLRDCCQIQSRSDLATDARAAGRFRALLTSFNDWTGKQTTPGA